MSIEDYEIYHQKGGTYVIPVEVFNELLEENQELKKQNEEYKRLGFRHLQNKCNELEKQLEKANTTLDTHNELIEYMKNQQKEFIEWLLYRIDYGTESISYRDSFREALSKYKEIIGVSNEK